MGDIVSASSPQDPIPLLISLSVSLFPSLSHPLLSLAVKHGSDSTRGLDTTWPLEFYARDAIFSARYIAAYFSRPRFIHVARGKRGGN